MAGELSLCPVEDSVRAVIEKSDTPALVTERKAIGVVNIRLPHVSGSLYSVGVQTWMMHVLSKPLDALKNCALHRMGLSPKTTSERGRVGYIHA